MNLCLLGHHDIASLSAMSRIIRAAPQHRHTVFLSGAVAGSKTLPRALRQLAAADAGLCELFLRHEATPASLAGSTDLPAPNQESGLSRLRQAEPDLIVSIRYRRILKDDAIAIPRFGVLNLHSGILPGYRGVMATFWAMLNNAPEIGTTLHRITDAGIDTGPIIKVSRQPLQRTNAYLENVLDLYDAGCASMLAAIDAIDRGEMPGSTPQQPGSGAYYSTPTATDLDRFLTGGHTLVSGNEVKRLELTGR